MTTMTYESAISAIHTCSALYLNIPRDILVAMQVLCFKPTSLQPRVVSYFDTTSAASGTGSLAMLVDSYKCAQTFRLHDPKRGRAIANHQTSRQDSARLKMNSSSSRTAATAAAAAIAAAAAAATAAATAAAAVAAAASAAAASATAAALARHAPNMIGLLGNQ